nr:hypothetical protein [Tanacetum cinerariifolium]
MERYPHLDNGIYDVVERVMRPLALRQTRQLRSDRGKARHSVSSTSVHHNRGSSSHQGDDDKDDGASPASTLSPTTYLNSFGPLEYQQYDVLTSSEQNDDLFFERQTDLLNQTQQMHKELRGVFKASIYKASKRPKINIIPPKQLFVDLIHDDSKTTSPKHQLSSPSASNGPLKTPSTKGTFSSSIDYTTKSLTLSISPSTNGYLNSPTSPLPRVPPPPPTQENTSMDITLTFSPTTPLDV